MNIQTVSQQTGFRILGPEGAKLGPGVHGQVEMVFNPWEPAMLALTFRMKDHDDSRWEISREAFTRATLNPDHPHSEGDFHIWHAADGRGLVMSMTDGVCRATAEILLCMATSFVNDVDALHPVGSDDEAAAMELLIDEVIDGIFESLDGDGEA